MDSMFSDFNGKSNQLSEYFSSRKPTAQKKINAQVDRDKWEHVKEYARYKGCPTKSIEDALVSYAIDAAYAEAQRTADTPAFLEWRRKQTIASERVRTAFSTSKPEEKKDGQGGQ